MTGCKPDKKIERTPAFVENLKRLEEVALKRGYRICAEEVRVQILIAAMAKGFIKTGEYYCPCKRSDPPDRVKDPRCPCPELDAEVMRDGGCSCGVFVKKDL